MKERPIIFSAEMVRALLDGRKTQTRRLIKPQPPNDVAAVFGDFSYGKPLHQQKCPYGQPGGRLWVRETFQPLCAHDARLIDLDYETGKGYSCSYPATDGIVEFIDIFEGGWSSRCKSSIHMPRWASRITLGITSIRAERVMDISEADAIAEGCRPFFDKRQPYIDNNLTFDPIAGPQKAFEYLWDSIYTKRHDGKYVWAANPWVWVVEFKVMKNG